MRMCERDKVVHGRRPGVGQRNASRDNVDCEKNVSEHNVGINIVETHLHLLKVRQCTLKLPSVTLQTVHSESNVETCALTHLKDK